MCDRKCKYKNYNKSLFKLEINNYIRYRFICRAEVQVTRKQRCQLSLALKTANIINLKDLGNKFIDTIVTNNNYKPFNQRAYCTRKVMASR